MDLRHVRAFVAVYEEGSINRAAERLGAAQPSLSVALRNLEGELGATLFERGPRGVHATDTAHLFYPHCQKLLAEFDAARKAVGRLLDTVSGSVAVGLAPTVAKGVLPEVLAAYARDFPQVSLRIVEAFSGTLTDWTLAGEVDVAIVAVPTTDRRLVIRRLTSEPNVLIAGTASGRRHLEPTSLRGGPPLKLVLPSDRHSLRHFLDRLVLSGLIPIERTIEIDGLLGTLEFVRRSDWVVLMPITTIVGELGERRFIVQPILDPIPELEFFLIHPARRTLSAAATLFIERLEAALSASLGEWHTARRAAAVPIA